jgi:ADP-ribosylglycohydrolase
MENEIDYLHIFEKTIAYDENHKSDILKSKDNFTSISIFIDESRGTISKDKKAVNDLLKILKEGPKSEREKKLKEFSDKEKRSIGSILGMAIGDAMGARLEFDHYIYEDDYEIKKHYNISDLKDMGVGPGGHFKLFPGQWTDDTSMGLCLADSLLVKGGILDRFDLMNRFIAWWRTGYNNAFRNHDRYNLQNRHSVGLGGNISLSFRQYREGPVEETSAGDENTSGNGSIMRNAAIPICFNKIITEACEIAKKQSLSTHKGIQAMECCNILTHIVFKVLNGQKLKAVLDNLKVEEILDQKYEEQYKKYSSAYESVKSLILSKPDKSGNDWNWRTTNIYKYNPLRAKKQPGYIGSYAMDNLAMSLNIVYRTDNFKDAIIKAVNIRGDSDSVASVVGQIAGAAYSLEGIPIDWIETIKKWDDGEIALRGYMLSRLQSGDSYYFKKEDKQKGQKQK